MSASQTIPSLHKAVSVLEYVSGRSEPVTVKELAYTLNIPQATCYRIVRTLTSHDLLREEPMGGVRIGFGLARLARAYSEVEYVLHELRAPLQHLAGSLDLAAKISLREGHWATTVLRAEPSSPNAITSPVGHRFHLAQGSAAGALLSTLPDMEIDRVLDAAPEWVWERQTAEEVWTRVRAVRETGVAADFGTQHPSIYAMSMLVRLSGDDAVSISVVGWPEEFAEGKREAIALRLREAVEEMNRLTGG